MKAWIKNTAIKVLKTMAETAAGYLAGAALLSEVDWVLLASATAISGILTILLNIQNIKTEGE